MAAAGGRCFYFAAAVAGALLIGNALLSQRVTCRPGLPAGQAASGQPVWARRSHAPPGLKALLMPAVGESRVHRGLACSRFGATIVRETFNTWTAGVPARARRLQPEQRGQHERCFFPLSVQYPFLLSGWLSDRIGENGTLDDHVFSGSRPAPRALLILTCLGPTPAGSMLAVGAIALVALCLLGPYSYLGGAYGPGFRR